MRKKLFTVSFVIFSLLLQIGASAAVAVPPDRGYVPPVTVYYDSNYLNGDIVAPKTGCRAVYAADPETGKVFVEKNAREKMFPASTTKILTALLVLENCDITETAVVSQNAVDLVPPDYVTGKLCAGETLDIESLLYVMLIPSANDAANVLAEHVAGSIEAFAELCNRRAKELGCENLHFVNPNGIHDENHYCSAYDLYLIAKECVRYDLFRKIVSTNEYTLPATDVYPKADRTFTNTNALIQSGDYYCKYCTGIKTGHTNRAGECLVGSASYNGTDIISVVLGGSSEISRGLNDRFSDTANIYAFVYNSYSVKTVAKSGTPFFTVSVAQATADTESLGLVIGTDISTIVPNNMSEGEIPFSISLKKDITAPVYKGQTLGEISFYADGMVCRTELLAAHNVKKINTDFRLLCWNFDFIWQ